MAIFVKNTANNETRRISGVKVLNNVIVPKNKNLGARFIETHKDVLSVATDSADNQTFTLCEGWALAKQPRPTKPATDNTPTTTTDNGTNENPVNEDTMATPAPATNESESVPATDATPAKPKKRTRKTTKPATTDADTTTPTTDATPANVDELKADLFAKYGAMGADIFEAACKLAKLTPRETSVNREDVVAIVNEQITNARPHNNEITLTINGESHTAEGVVTANFAKIALTVKKGYPVYMWGDAGTGKSHTAKQIADALGLDFYESQQVLFAHEMKGYGDAGGNYVQTPFFKAFTKGGLFFLDEIDASQPEALVVLNTAIANGRFDFPVIGNVNAHPNFRVIAAGNTKMTGADLEHTARSVQDASTKNRFFFVGVDYTPEIENDLAGDDLSVADFCRDLRNAKNKAEITLCVSYRQIQTLADADLVKAWGRADLLKCAVFKELERDEIRNLYGFLADHTNKWAKAMQSLI